MKRQTQRNSASYQAAESAGFRFSSSKFADRNRGPGRGRERFYLAAAFAIFLATLPAFANPIGMTVAHGSGSTVQNGPQLTVRASDGAVLNWQSFNVQRGQTTTFLQPSATSVVWNRILDPNLSQVWGTINANGWVVLMNQNGFYFGPNSVVNVRGLMVTTFPIAPESFGGGGMWQFNGTPPLASIINYGEIHARSGGSVFLVSERIENHGTISAPGGAIGLYAGKEVLVSERPDGRGISASVRLPAGSVDNSGKLIADAGTIALHAEVVNQNGFVQANSVRQRHGVIELVASEELNLGANSQILARGDDTPGSGGGDVTLKSAQTFRDHPGSEVITTGGANGGNGGNVEISAPNIASLDSRIDASAQRGSRPGRLLLDPDDIVLDTFGTDSAGTGTINAGDGTGTLDLNVGTAFLNINADITLQATKTITLAPGTIWDLSATTGFSEAARKLTLQAGTDIIFNNNAVILDANNWSVNLAAGGSIFLNGGFGRNLSGAVETSQGSIDMTAGGSILVGLGYIRTVGGGNINLQTLTGDIDAGLKPDGYRFFRATTTSAGSGYDISTLGLGGIGTAYGGNVTLDSGHDILSIIPTVGAYGVGDVTLRAADRIVGKFIVRSGHGVINAGGDLGSASSPASLSLVGRDWLSSGTVTVTQSDPDSPDTSHPTAGTTVIASDAIFSADHVGQYILFGGILEKITGFISPTRVSVDHSRLVDAAIPFKIQPLELASGWDVHAHNIYLNEVLNPNGVFNNNFVGTSPDRSQFRFDYAPDAYVNLTADSVQLLGSSLAHSQSGLNSDRPPIYPPQLIINAGAGGVTLGNDVVLYPSQLGELHITTTGGGSMASTPGNYFQMIMSDSGSLNYKNFATDHAATPLHVWDTDPVRLTIDGDVQNFFLRSPKQAVIGVGGNALNFTFEGQHLSASDSSSITIAGDLKSRSDRTTSDALSDGPSQASFDHIFVDPFYQAGSDVLGSDVLTKVSFDSVTHKLVFQGVMTADDKAFLLHPYVKVLDQFNNPVVDANGIPVYARATFTTDTATIEALYASTLDIPTSGLAYSGLQIGGRGTLAVSARNMDLGISHGIRSVGTFLNSSLVPFSQEGNRLLGANLTLELAGDLTMTSSQIASYSGGDIAVTANTPGATLNIGSQGQFSSDDTPKGIYSAHGGNVTVTADGLINVNGSRIGTYDGGDVGVESVHGTVDAGGGARGSFTLTTQQLDSNGQLEVRPDKFFGSGIVALTRPDSSALVGNINVKAHDDILASAGGILQLAFNGTDVSHAQVTLDAGHDIVANQSGVLGANISLHAGNDIIGLVVGSGNVAIHADVSVSANVLGGGNVSVSGGQSVSGSIVGGGAVNVSGSEITASVTSTAGSASTSGDASGAKVGGFQSAAAPVAQQTTTETEKKTVAAKTDEEDEEQKKKRAAAGPVLSKTVGRVTVILPNKQ